MKRGLIASLWILMYPLLVLEHMLWQSLIRIGLVKQKE